MLRGTLQIEGRGPSAAIEPAATIVVAPRHNRTSAEEWDASSRIEGSIANTGPFSLDVTAACALLQRRGGENVLELEVSHPDYAHARFRVPVADPSLLLTGRADLAPVEVLLRLVGRVGGRVLDIDGSPRPGARVAIFVWRQQTIEPEPVASASTDEEGSFSLASPLDGRHVVVAVWEEYDLVRGRTTARRAPAAVLVDVKVAQVVQDLRLQLRAGQTLRGRVLRDGAVGEAVRISWNVVAEGQTFSLEASGSAFRGEDRLLHVAGEAHHASGEAQSEADGSFAIHGLASLPHRLRVVGAPHALLHEEAKNADALLVQPPTYDVVIDLRTTRLVVVVRADGVPVRTQGVCVSALGAIDPKEMPVPEGMDPADIQVCWDSFLGTETDEDGRLAIDLSPGRKYGITIDDPRYEPYSQEIVAAEPGRASEHVVDLVPRGPRPRLVVTLESPDGQVPDLAGFGFYFPTESPTSATPYPIREVRAADGAFALDDLAPGAYRLHVRPGRSWNGRPGDWAEATVDIEVPERGEVHRSVVVRRGGRLQIDVVDPEGRSLRATCRIRDGSGQPVPAWFRFEDDMGNIALSTDALPGMGPCDVEPVLLPGSYRVEVRQEGYEPQEASVSVVAGKPTAVRMTLQK